MSMITIADLAAVALEADMECPRCRGAQVVPRWPDAATCPLCDGLGFVKVSTAAVYHQELRDQAAEWRAEDREAYYDELAELRDQRADEAARNEVDPW
jgi:hypothetical protein